MAFTGWGNGALAWEKKASDGGLPLALIDWAPQEATRWGLINRVEEGP